MDLGLFKPSSTRKLHFLQKQQHKLLPEIILQKSILQSGTGKNKPIQFPPSKAERVSQFPISVWVNPTAFLLVPMRLVAEFYGRIYEAFPVP